MVSIDSPCNNDRSSHYNERRDDDAADREVDASAYDWSKPVLLDCSRAVALAFSPLSNKGLRREVAFWCSSKVNYGLPVAHLYALLPAYMDRLQLRLSLPRTFMRSVTVLTTDCRCTRTEEWC